MEETPQIERQGMGCGFEPPAPPLVGVRIWDNVARDPERNAPLTVCPGYTCGLPEVRETSFARLHWKHQQASTWARGPLTEQQISAIEVLEMSSQASEQWALEHPVKKGG